ncbi:MAG: hypothetical protein NZ822_01640 [Patescibacteria group bacterium]|nr:hypothetical protein [Patescibacteria group bacterium]
MKDFNRIESVDNFNREEYFKKRYPGIIQEIIFPSGDDLRIISEAEEILSKFPDDSAENLFLRSLIDFLKSSIIILTPEIFPSHSERRKWLTSLPTEDVQFFENNRLRINKIFPLIWSLSEVLENLSNNQNLKSEFNEITGDLYDGSYDQLSIEDKINLINELREFALKILEKLK